MSYTVKLEIFEGPFDLLLNLISKHKLDIYDIPIGEITDQYLDYLEKIDELDLEIASEFLLVAATLLEIKSAGLLPREEKLSDVEDLSAFEKRELLIARLIEYKKFKNAGQSLGARIESHNKFYERNAAVEPEFQDLLPDFLIGISTEDLRDIFEKIQKRQSLRLIDSSHIATIPISIESKLEEITELLRLEPRQSFREMTIAATGRDEVVATFLALLELYKKGVISLNQATTFGDIEIEAEESLDLLKDPFI